MTSITTVVEYEFSKGNPTGQLVDTKRFQAGDKVRLVKIRYGSKSSTISAAYENNVFSVGGRNITLDQDFPNITQYVDSVNFEIRQIYPGVATKNVPQIHDINGLYVVTQDEITSTFPFKPIVFPTKTAALTFGITDRLSITEDESVIFPDPRLGSTLELEFSTNKILLPILNNGETALYEFANPVRCIMPETILLTNVFQSDSFKQRQVVIFEKNVTLYLEFIKGAATP